MFEFWDTLYHPTSWHEYAQGTYRASNYFKIADSITMIGYTFVKVKAGFQLVKTFI